MDYVIYLALSALILPFHGIYATVHIQNCESNWVSIKEQEQSKIHCTFLDATDTVVWYIDTDPDGGRYTWVELGRCPPSAPHSSCKTNLSDLTFSRTETTSTMIIQSNHRYFSQKPLKCSNERGSAFICQARVLHYGQPSQCKIFVHSDNKTVSGSCYTEKWFTSDNYYTCQWGYAAKNITGSSNIPLETVLIRSPKKETNIFYRATCAFSTSMNNGAYNFFIKFTPGPKISLVGDGSVHIPPKDFIAGEQRSISQTLAIIPGSTPRLIMTCAGFQPYASTHLFKWTGVTCDNGTTKETCAFTPDADVDSGRQATCSVTFGQSGKVVNASFRLRFKTAETSPRTVASTPTRTASGPQTTTTKGTTAEEPPPGNQRGDNSEAVSNGGVPAVAGGKSTQSNGDHDQELEEHVNTLYEPGPDPNEINDIHQPASRYFTAHQQPGLDTVDPTYEDHNLDSYDDGYAAVSTGSPQGNGSFPQTHQPSLDHDLYSDVDAPISKPAVAVSGQATQGDEYAVVEKSRKRNTEPTFQPDVYAQVNKSRPKTGGDVYAQVNKPGKRAKSSPVQQNADEGDGNYGEVQKPKPDLKPKPTLKSKPTAAVKPNPKDTSDPVKTSGGDDEYNVLTFHLRNSDTPTNPDAGQLYSHIGTVSDTMATP
ncbi:hypothetical protein BaRGS_00028049 [Batillaria attramentaria]|uniref:Uncharacterized protein n=1 Tax=Batillaria attramentaria TaxID=370345 RepID=A0ABD0K010_9CAEN